MEPKNVKLKKILTPLGFKRKKPGNGRYFGSVYFRYYGNESVQAVRLVRQRTGETNLYASAFSIYDPELSKWLEDPAFTPVAYSAANFAGLRLGPLWYTPQEKRKEIDPSCIFSFTDRSAGTVSYSYSPTAEEEMNCLQNFVIPRLNGINSQEKLLQLYHDLDMAEYGKEYLLRRERIYPALACGKYDEVFKTIHAIIEQNKSAMIRKKEYMPETDYSAYCRKVEAKWTPLLEIKAMLDNNEEGTIRAILSKAKDQNLLAWNALA